MKPINLSTLIKFAITGAVIALILISLLIFSVNTPKPEWGQHWYIRPLIVTQFVTSIGGIALYLLNLKDFKSKILNLILLICSILIFVFFLWIGTILGLDGTLWN
ncbi:potassium transporter KefB [Flavobacterium okayamense]|uniref:Uncharacterized protein n=1 Tax=Flavobacterium okayamense TaxID=2830782 RepID=A0ABM7S8Y3_9FLAO|nr:potassium transporter KefB [Flavobacterium okayamense]BCY29398.1 hypothetical protein KK2020170_22660 [Flavobacterium okayamense]